MHFCLDFVDVTSSLGGIQFFLNVSFPMDIENNDSQTNYYNGINTVRERQTFDLLVEERESIFPPPTNLSHTSPIFQRQEYWIVCVCVCV